MESSFFSNVLLSLLIFLIAVLYSSCGHGGASGYLAVMSLFAFNPKEMVITALVLNILVSTIAFYSYLKAGYFSMKFTLPFIIASVPFAFIGGFINVTGKAYFLLLALALLVASYRMFVKLPEGKDSVPASSSPNIFLALLSGGLIGLVSGVVGIGGGIFLSPLLIINNWSSPKVTSATASFFILVNSVSGLFGQVLSLDKLLIQNLHLHLVVFAFLGGLVGSYFGANIFSNTFLKRVLGIVLVIASLKLLIKVFH